jgi:lipoate-protein ligase A
LVAKGRFLDKSYSSVSQNLALEEALARSRSSSSPLTIRIWANPRAVVLGRFQEVSSEVDVAFCRRNEIQVGRRFTGGGAVFHDEGNLNLTIVTSRQRRLTLSQLFQENCTVILSLLKGLGLEGNFIPPNSIEVFGRKVSGAAAALGRDFAFWHASLLVSTDEQMLNEALKPRRVIIDSQFIRSRRRPIITLTRALGKQLGVERVKESLMSACRKLFEFEVVGLSEEEGRVMKSLHDSKYSSNEWNLSGYQREAYIKRSEGGTHTTIAV